MTLIPGPITCNLTGNSKIKLFSSKNMKVYTFLDLLILLMSREIIKVADKDLPLKAMEICRRGDHKKCSVAKLKLTKEHFFCEHPVHTYDCLMKLNIEE